MSDNLPQPPKPSYKITSQFLIWLLPLILPLIRQFAGRLIARLTAFLVGVIGTFWASTGITPDEFAAYGVDLDLNKVVTGVVTVVIAAIVLAIEATVSWVSTKLVPPPKAVSVNSIRAEEYLGSDMLPPDAKSVTLTVEPKLKLPK